jgi:hypothetical protein
LPYQADALEIASHTVGTSPTSTAQTHATIGTGAFPDAHLLVAHRLRIGADLTTPWAKGPAYLMEPTLADLYDRAMGNRPVVGVLGTVSIHLGMLGHGAMWGGGDQDIAVIRERIGADTLGAEGFDWNLTPELMAYYRSPATSTGSAGLARTFGPWTRTTAGSTASGGPTTSRRS